MLTACKAECWWRHRKLSLRSTSKPFIWQYARSRSSCASKETPFSCSSVKIRKYISDDLAVEGGLCLQRAKLRTEWPGVALMIVSRPHGIVLILDLLVHLIINNLHCGNTRERVRIPPGSPFNYFKINTLTQGLLGENAPHSAAHRTRCHFYASPTWGR